MQLIQSQVSFFKTCLGHLRRRSIATRPYKTTMNKLKSRATCEGEANM